MIGKDRNHEFFIALLVYGLVVAILLPACKKHDFPMIIAFIAPLLFLFIFSGLMNFFDKRKRNK